MNKIKILSEKAINRIAAGEVIERPLSVVKELIENSIDALATEISITISRGGRTLIRVSDNGIGIDKDDMELTIKRHATSKLQEEDIDNISYLGFRGEALASIASVSKIKIISRTSESEIAWEFDSYNCNPASHHIGTTVEIKDLFCLTPNRLRFLKSEQYENALCIDLVQNIAIAHPEIGFTLISNDKEVFQYPKKCNEESRINNILGHNFIDNAVKFYEEVPGRNLTVYGYTAVPTYHNKKSKIICSVNGRVIKDTFLQKIIRAAYFNILSDKFLPEVVMFIQIDSHLIDVNVHPTKTQIRFCDENLIRNTIIKVIRNALSKAKSVDHNIKTFPSYSSEIPRAPYLGGTSMIDTIPDNQNLFERDSFTKYSQNSYDSKSNQKSDIGPNNESGINIFQKESTKELIETNYFGNAVCQIGLRYIISEISDGIIIVDQHAAHERIVLEQMKTQMDHKINQGLLIEEKINFSIGEQETLLAIKDKLENLGISIEKKSNNDIVIKALNPVIFHYCDISALLTSILQNIDISEEVTLDQIYKICSEKACHNSIRSGRKLNAEEMNNILRDMEKYNFTSQCNHGRPTYVRLPYKFIDKLFERR